MTSKFWVYTGDRPSNGAKALSECEGFKRCRTGKFLKPDDTFINWGCSTIDTGYHVVKQILNKPEKVHLAANKAMTFEAWAKANVTDVVHSTTDKEVAQVWLTDNSHVVVRNKLTGHSGDGIVIIEPGQPLPDAPLYTKYVFKDKEFRVHVVNGKVIDTQQKIKDPDREVVTWKVRSHDNGFIFARNNIVANADRDALACTAVATLGLDFGAVDVMMCKTGKLYLLEVNTAPGLEGQTVTSYAEAFSGSSSEAEVQG